MGVRGTEKAMVLQVWIELHWESCGGIGVELEGVLQDRMAMCWQSCMGIQGWKSRGSAGALRELEPMPSASCFHDYWKLTNQLK